MNPLLYIPVGPQRLGVDMKTAMRVRNMSGGSTGSLESDLSRSWGSTTSSLESSGGAPTGMNSPVGLMNESSDSTRNGQQGKNILNPGRYKTEMCRPFTETGHCKYGDKCQFAHGSQDLRGLPRHPKYKTELCRTFHTVGFCPYGPRCHFIHSEDETKLVEINAMKQQQAAQQAAREMAQLQAQQHLLTSQFTALVSQVHLTNHLVSPGQNVSPVFTAPGTFHQPPPPPQSVNGLPTGSTNTTLPNPLVALGSTADSPPDSPIGSISDDVFLVHRPTESCDHHHQQQPMASVAAPGGSFVTDIVTVPKVEGLGMALGDMVLDPNNHHQALTCPPAPLSSTNPVAFTAITTELQPVSPPSSPDSLCSSLDSQRSSRLPVFSKLAGDN